MVHDPHPQQQQQLVVQHFHFFLFKNFLICKRHSQILKKSRSGLTRALSSSKFLTTTSCANTATLFSRSICEHWCSSHPSTSKSRFLWSFFFEFFQIFDIFFLKKQTTMMRKKKKEKWTLQKSEMQLIPSRTPQVMLSG